MQIFYAPKIKETPHLPEDEARHCFKVLRKQNGDTITVIDGQGTFYECALQGHAPRQHRLQIIRTYPETSERQRYLHIAMAPTKNIDRTEWFVEKAVEIGVNEVSFILCERSERKVIKINRLERKAVSAAKQSLKATVPIINDLRPLSDVIKTMTMESTKLIAHLNDQTIPISDIKKTDHITILIGPEGDFSDVEVRQCEDLGFQSVGLGPSRLRTETAGIVACTLLNF